MTGWYYELNGSQIGPIQEEDLKQLYSSNTINADTLVWNLKFGNSWKQLEHAGIENLNINRTKIVGPPPLPVNILNANKNEETPFDPEKDQTAFLESDITKSLIGDKIDYYQTKWKEILSKSVGSPGKLHQVVSWNGAAFVSPVFWLAYRKMYKAAIAIAILSLFALFFGITGLVLCVLITIAIGMYGNSLYLQSTYNKYVEINRISDKSLATSKALNRGGVSYSAAWAVTLLFAVLFIFINSGKNIGSVFSTSPGCSSTSTIETVQRIAKKNLVNQAVFFYGVDVEKSSVNLSYIRTQDTNGNIVQCAAHISYDLYSGSDELRKASEILEKNLEKDIVYTVQPNDDGKGIYVIVKGLK